MGLNIAGFLLFLSIHVFLHTSGVGKIFQSRLLHFSLFVLCSPWFLGCISVDCTLVVGAVYGFEVACSMLPGLV